MPRTRSLIPAILAIATAVSCSSGTAPPAAKDAPPAAKDAAAAPGAAGRGRGRGMAGIPELPKAEFTEVVVPGGTSFDVALETALASDRNRIEDPVRTRVVTDVVVRGRTAIPKGTEVTGTILQATPAGRSGGHAALAFRLLDIHAGDRLVRIRVDRVAKDAASADAEVTFPAGATFHLSLDDAVRVQVPNN